MINILKTHARLLVFPAIVTVILLTFTVLGISGSSLGVFDNLLTAAPTANTLSGHARGIRSDEWSIVTPLTIAQSKDGFPISNKNVSKGQDMSVVIDVPYAGWSTAFRPQNLLFFIIPAVNAFAFKWWFLSWVLLLGAYFFTLLFTKRYWMASLIAIFSLMTPFLQWWYQNVAVLSIGYSLLLLVVATHLLRSKKIGSRVVLSTLLGYITTCFLLLLYPPFQIPTALFAVSVFLGIYFSENKLDDLWEKRIWLRFALPLLASALISLVFVFFHRGTISAIEHTVYPGSRDVAAGGGSIAPFLYWPLSQLMLRDTPLSIFGQNQSEASSFIFVGLLLVPYLSYYFMRNWNKVLVLRRSVFIASSLLLAVLFARMFIPVGGFLYKLVGLNLVTQPRLIIGMGMINITMMVLAVSLPTKQRKGLKSYVDSSVIINFLLAFCVILTGLFAVKLHYGLPGTGLHQILVIVVILSLSVAALTHKFIGVRYFGLLLAVIFSLSASLTVNPLYRGFGSLVSSPLSKTIQNIASKDKSYWVTEGDIRLESIPIANGAREISGVNTYPQTALWSKYFPGKESIYNRYAHVVFNLDDSIKNKQIRLNGPDSFIINVPSCDPMLRELDVEYLLIVSPSPMRCAIPVPYPGEANSNVKLFRIVH